MNLGFIFSRKILLIALLTAALLVSSISGAVADLSGLSGQVNHLQSAAVAVSNVQVSPATLPAGTDSVTISYKLSLNRAGIVVNVYNSGNTLVRTLDQGEKDPGTYSLTWDGKDASGTALPPGNYKIEVKATSKKVAGSYAFLAQWGSKGSGQGQFDIPLGITVDGSSNVYVIDKANNRVQKFSSGGAYISKWGSLGTGNGQFKEPYGVAADESGNIYVADTGNNRVSKFTSGGTFLQSWGSSGTGSGYMSEPVSLAAGTNSVYVGDSGNSRVQKFSPSGEYASMWSIQEAGHTNTPWGLAVDGSGNVYVADSSANDILKLGPGGGLLTRWGVQGTGDGQFMNPMGVALDSAGRVYVSDGGNNRVQVFSADGTYITQWGSKGSGQGQFDAPRGIAVDSDDNVYVVDAGNSRIQKFSQPSMTAKNSTTLTIEKAQIGLVIPSKPAGSGQVETATPTPTAGGSRLGPLTGTLHPQINGTAAVSTPVPTAIGQTGTDTTAPVTTITVNGTPGSLAGSYASTVKVSLTASDGDGSGIREIQYNFDGKSWLVYAEPFTVTEGGNTTIYGRSIDNAGNVEAGKSVTFTIASASPSPTKSTGLCGAALLPLLLVGIVTVGTLSQRKGRKN